MKRIYSVFIGLGCLISVLPFIVLAIPLPGAATYRTASNQSFAAANSSVPWKTEMVLEDLEAAAASSRYRSHKSERQIRTNGTWPGQEKMGLFPGAYRSKLRTAEKAAEKAAATAAAAPVKFIVSSTTKRLVAPHPLTKAGLNFWAKPKVKPKGDVGNFSADGNGTEDAAAPGERAPKIQPRAGDNIIRTKSLERTVSIPRLHSDRMGNWVFNPWGITFGVLWQDTRMHYQVKSSMTEILEDTPWGGNYALKYNKPQTKVCRGKSTIYNKPRVYKWLERRILLNETMNFKVFSKYRPIWLDLRREIYTMGRSEACHISAMDDWLLYNNCAILRNMRMEYLIPKYPLHQIGYWHKWYRKELTYKL
ncbi:uncharacterized protein LOC111075901 [Drosophila obscura]|uniref:uncharacterized protein LOC111075901 n=1 Tax=Drosophila obscura TaxID=7282 RepID=UPI001BB2C9A9|nr:uncharacterized protein LOC111075901 [Drosophila obscura]